MCSSSREIITLQFGHYANFVGTHLWNIHEEQFANLPYFNQAPNELDYDVLYREGLNSHNKTTFTPRLLMVDLKGSLKSLPEVSDLYGEECDQNDVQWNLNNLEVKEEEQVEKNEFLTKFERLQNPDFKFKLNEEDINVWSDFNYSRFHPRSVNVIKEHSSENIQDTFSHFQSGIEIWENELFHEEFCDKIRAYAEECDLMQGFQIILDMNNGFSGLSSSCIEYLTDEYDKKTTITFPVLFESIKNQKNVTEISKALLNTVLLYDSLAQNSSMFVPMSTSMNLWKKLIENRAFTYLNYKTDFMYHTSALLASALDTFTLHYRMKNEVCNTKMQDVVADLTCFDKICVSGSLLMPLNYHKAEIFSDFFEKEPLVCLTPHCDLDYNSSVQFFGLRGFSPSVFKNDPYFKQGNSFMFRNREGECSFNHVANVQRALPISGTFPNIINHPEDKAASIPPAAIKTIAGLHSNLKIGEMFRDLLEEEKKLRISRRELNKQGIELDNYKECIERLWNLESQYTNKRFYDE